MNCKKVLILLVEITEKTGMRALLLLFLPLLISCSSEKFYFHSIDQTIIATSTASGDWEKEEFVLESEKSLVDILIVVDTSGSMHHHLGQMGRSLSDLLSVISHYSWQIGITSADHGDHARPSGLQQSWRNYMSESEGKFGSLMNLESERRILQSNILTPSTPDYEGVFLHSLSHNSSDDCHRPPYCHGRLEQPLRSLKSAIHRASLDNSSFFRPKADFVSLIITNEEERREDRRRATRATQVQQSFNEVFGHLDKKFIAFNILIMDEACLATERQSSDVASSAPSIAELAKITGGYNISICSKNYGEVLRELSKHIKNTLENSILLAKEPIPETVEVEFIEGRELDWKQYGRNIIFENRGSKPIHVSVTYQSLD